MQRGVAVLLFLFLLCGILFWGLKSCQHESLSSLEYKDYISLIASLASLFVALAFILEYCQVQKTDKDLKLLSFADDTRDYWDQLEQRFQDPDLFELYSQIHPYHPDLHEFTPSTSNAKSQAKSQAQKIKEIQAVSFLLRSIENMRILHNPSSCDVSHRQNQQLKVWKYWFQHSPILRYHYQFLQHHLGEDTNHFIQTQLLPIDRHKIC